MAVLSWKQRAALVKRYTNLTGSKAIYFLALTQGESSGDTTAYNGTIGTYGLWQIDASSHRDKFTGPDERLYNPVVNVKVAEKVYNEAGDFGPWAVVPSEDDLKDAEQAMGTKFNIIDVLADIPGVSGMGGTVIGGIEDAVGNIPNPLDPIQEAWGAVKAALGWITDPHNWLRIATFLGGMAVLLVAGWALLKDTSAGKQAISVGTAVATKGKVS